ncbi:ATP-dependent RNA helicase DbpA [Marinicella litoralis]|uniref:ATP-dependent RNA helicase DbpA n=1 Tax=Marinicella litoralis TaxID=644220 RepID=A0A4R6XMZ1_9GAMM|nr:ATP-dependent RNA helicase DbpA [Marinicella litoralis]TDR17478.1 ATP-dependent RNA helicase DbpA [Marinicella litoralis]
MTQSFSQLPLSATLIENLQSLDYVQMTEVQAQALPEVLNKKDVIVQAKTGSGKTAVFGLGVLNQLDVASLKVQSMVLCPTRELADQVAAEIRRLARSMPNVKIVTLCGGVPARSQVSSLEHGAHVVIGTPGRIQDHLDRGSLLLDELNLFVLDEADRMLDMGFQQALDDIIAFVPKQRQTLLFSATYPKKIASIADHVMQQPIMIKVKGNNDSDIAQSYYRVKNNEDRLAGIQLLMLAHRPERVLIFCNTKADVKEVTQAIMNYGFNVLALHGDLEQKDRDQTLIRFTNKSTTVLVATDVAARGLDIDDLDMVINYHIASDTEVHLHRIGRTGRAGKQGSAHSFYAEKESYKMKRLSEFLEVEIVPSQLPSHSVLHQNTYKPPMMTLRISGGKKQKLRAGDILGALTSENGISGQQVGKITLFDHCAYVAVNRDTAQMALNKLRNDKMKGKTFKIWLLKD